MADDNNIIRLAELQNSGKGIPPTAEDSIALAFADRHAHELRYVAIWRRWLAFGGAHWAHDDTLHVFDRARAICREAAAESRAIAGSVASAKTVAAVERLARSDRRLAATAAQWDAEPWLLTAGDRTIDLRTGVERAPDPADYITRAAGCAAAGAAHPTWTKFLRRVTGEDFELEQFLQRYAGYCCSGNTSEHAFVFAYGTGANGKSTFVSTIAKIPGEYATVADMNTFLASNSERHPTDLAKLAGARFVVAQETQKGRRWDETKLKALTGGDKIAARFMRADYFDYEPTFKLLIAGSHKPRLDSVDEAMRRRLLLVPFTVQIPPAERDPELTRKLQPEWPAILRWCIDGCFAWQRIGLAPPTRVREATENYFADEDTVSQWLEECTHDGGQFAFTRSRELFASWKIWCENCNQKPGSMKALSQTLIDKEFKQGRDPQTRQKGFVGLSVNG